MANRKKILVALGTRPEAIKLAPVVLGLRESGSSFECIVCGTAQHREMLDQVLSVFGIELDFDLRLMTPDQAPADVISRGLPLLMDAIRESSPRLVMVQGDTVSTFASAYAAFLSKVPVAHVEAGLRTLDKYHPFPEEQNRRLTSTICDYHFAPTERARQNLLVEGVDDRRILVTGNTVVDALNLMLSRENKSERSPVAESQVRLILVTVHRRESFGEPMKRICSVLRRISLEHPECSIVFPVHPNPNVQSVVRGTLSGLPNVALLAPLPYDEFILLMKRAYLIITDSGGIQEEAPSLGKPVLILRDKTERPEGIETGLAVLVGSAPDRIYDVFSRMLNDQPYYMSLAVHENPYGDGLASKRIVDFLTEQI